MTINDGRHGKLGLMERFPPLALLGFFPPVWLVGIVTGSFVWLAASILEPIAMDVIQAPDYKHDVLLWPLASYRQLRQRKFARKIRKWESKM